MTHGEFSRLLHAERRYAASQIVELQQSFDDIVEASESVALDDEHDPDGSTVAFERAQVAALLDRARLRLNELDEAERRLQDGSFGICKRCSEPIALERLRAMPLATNCVSC